MPNGLAFDVLHGVRYLCFFFYVALRCEALKPVSLDIELECVWNGFGMELETSPAISAFITVSKTVPPPAERVTLRPRQKYMYVVVYNNSRLQRARIKPSARSKFFFVFIDCRIHFVSIHPMLYSWA